MNSDKYRDFVFWFFSLIIAVYLLYAMMNHHKYIGFVEEYNGEKYITSELVDGQYKDIPPHKLTFEDYKLYDEVVEETTDITMVQGF